MTATPQQEIITPAPNTNVHETHDMAYAPCLYLECKKCWLSPLHNEEELAKPCEGLTFPQMRNDIC